MAQLQDEYTFDVHNIDVVVSRVECQKHKASIDKSCWSVETTTGLVLGAICNRRARRAGFVGRPTRKSLGR